MTMKSLLWSLFVLSLVASFTSSVRITYNDDDGGYENLVIAVHPIVEENPLLIDQIKSLINRTSHALFKATDGRAYFKSASIILPSTWSDNEAYEAIGPGAHFQDSHIRVDLPNPYHDDEPYTLQIGECGEPGQYIHITPLYLMGIDDPKPEFGPPEKVLLKEWARFRYGVFEENGVPGSATYPTLTLTPDKKIVPTSCTHGIKGWFRTRTGRRCKAYNNGDHIDAFCRFIPDAKRNDASASLMFSTNVKSIEGFCKDDRSDPLTLHNIVAPTKHNLLCDRRPVWDVIASHDDFKNRLPLQKPTSLVPEFRIKRVSELINSQFVLVLDTSGSMNGTRINILNRAGQRFLRDLVPDGISVGVVKFSTMANLTHEIVEVNEETRSNLTEAILSEAEGYTAIGEGLFLALEMLRVNGPTDGSTIILISDGQENIGYPRMAEVFPDILRAGIKLDTIAVGIESDERLNLMSHLSGGRVFYINDVDQSTNTAMETAFQGAVDEQTETEIKPVVLLNRDLQTVSSQRLVRVVNIDKELGINSLFLVTSDYMDSLDIKFRSPSGEIYEQGDANYFYNRESDTKLKLKDAETGRWEIIVENLDPDRLPQIDVAITVRSEPRDVAKQPVRLRSWFSQLQVRYPATAKLFAELKRGYNAVVNASVLAIVERPTNDTVEVQLRDDGMGADIVKNDGIYSAYFTEFTLNGHYSVKTKVFSDQNTKIKVRMPRSVEYEYEMDNEVQRSKREAAELNEAAEEESLNPDDWEEPKSEFTIEDFDPVPDPPPYPLPIPHNDPMEEGVGYEDLNHGTEREDIPGAFKVHNYRPEIDLMPPGRVTDLRVALVPEFGSGVLRVTWTAAGDDMDRGRASLVDLRISLESSIIASETEFLKSYRLHPRDIIRGDLRRDLVEGGQLQDIVVRIPDYFLQFPGRTIYLALMTIDEAYNRSPISNMAFASVDQLKPPEADETDAGFVPRPPYAGTQTHSRLMQTYGPQGQDHFGQSLVSTETHMKIPITGMVEPLTVMSQRLVMNTPTRTLYINMHHGLGRNTMFTISSDYLRQMQITVICPEGIVYDDDDMTSHSKGTIKELEIEGLASPGAWKLTIEKGEMIQDQDVDLLIFVYTEPRSDLVETKAWIRSDGRGNLAVQAKAEISRNLALACGQMEAHVVLPNDDRIVVPLNDDGSEMDTVKNDGIYSGRLNLPSPDLAGMLNQLRAVATVTQRQTGQKLKILDIHKSSHSFTERNRDRLCDIVYLP